MNRVLQLKKKLLKAPVVTPIAGFRLETFVEEEDLASWLTLRQATFAREKLGVRDWNVEDFHQEFVTKPWWDPDNCWVLQEIHAHPNQASLQKLVGSVTLAMRGSGSNAQPVVHWMMVYPRFRHAGLGRWLLATLEEKAWHLGYRSVCLETHSAWQAAARFYASAGYLPSDGTSQNS